MKHPFDDFLPPSWHQKRSDIRVVRLGIILVAVVSLSTAAAFSSSMSSWKNLLVHRSSIDVRWQDAQSRVESYINAQNEIRTSIETAKSIEQFTDGIPRSLLLWELTQLLPEQARLDDVRLETRRRLNAEEVYELTEIIMLQGIAPDDASISTYIEKLSSSQFFTNVSLMYAQQYQNGIKRKYSLQMEVSTNAKLTLEASE